MEVTFLRHAQSIFNRDGTSEKDCQLTDYGIEQAKEIKGTYDIIICSTMKRAKQTLQYSELSSKELHFTDLCREVRRDICDFLEGEDETKLETDQELQRRMKEFKQFLYSKGKPGAKVLVICHRDFIHEIGNKKYPEPKNAELQTIRLE
jgi:broad specificity phosphatase PhoE